MKNDTTFLATRTLFSNPRNHSMPHTKRSPVPIRRFNSLRTMPHGMSRMPSRMSSMGSSRMSRMSSMGSSRMSPISRSSSPRRSPHHLRMGHVNPPMRTRRNLSSLHLNTSRVRTPSSFSSPHRVSPHHSSYTSWKMY